MNGVTRHLDLGRPVQVSTIFALLRKGAGDPTSRRLGDIYLRATRTPAGPALVKVVASGTEISARAWGEGAEWVLDQLPRFAGEADDLAGFVPRPEHAVLVGAALRYPHYRVGRTDGIFEALAPACIEQVVTGKEAFRAWRLLVREFSEPAPGPTQDPDSAAYGMYLPPTPHAWAHVPTWRFLAAGVEQRRSRTLVRTAVRAEAIERLLTGTSEAADRALRSFPGVGAWTSAEVRQRAFGDADAWSIGDYHVAKDITYALTGEVLDDDACTEILEPYRGHRFRVQALLGMVGSRRPRHGPRMTLPTLSPFATRGM